VFAENVPGLLVPHRDNGEWRPAGMRTVLGDLARLGYVGCWLCLRASDFGASHIRKRVFIVAYNSRDFGRGESQLVSGGAVPGGVSAAVSELAHGPRGGFGELRKPSGSDGFIDGSHAELADTERTERKCFA
jgi:DNA (cytosine-5)-methyltransferase 1